MSDTPGKTPVIMQVLPELSAGGAEQGAIDIAASAVEAGGRSLIVSNGGNRVHEARRAGVQHINLPVHSKNPVTMARNTRRLAALIEEHNVDVLHARSRAPAWSAKRACTVTGAHFITTCHAPYKTGGRLKKCYNAIMTKGERVIAISDYVADYLRQNYRINPDRIRTIPRGIAIDKFHPTTVTPVRMIDLSQQWRIPEGASVVLMPARLTRWKGHHVLIEAIARLGRSDVFCLIIGDDQGRKNYRKELEDMIEANNLGGCTRIVDHCLDMPAAYMLATVVCVPSLAPEGFGRVAVEAQAMGRAVVAADHGAARETIRRGETGWLVPPGDVEALAASIEQALQLTQAQRAVLATRAMAHVAQNFTRESMCDKTLDVYAEILGKSPKIRQRTVSQAHAESDKDADAMRAAE